MYIYPKIILTIREALDFVLNCTLNIPVVSTRKLTGRQTIRTIYYITSHSISAPIGIILIPAAVSSDDETPSFFVNSKFF